MIGLINGGVSGFTMGHSDIGGYTSVKIPKPSPISYVRSRELLYRWIEMSTFSDMIMRSHPSNLPDADFQIYNDEAAVNFMAKFVKIHVRLEAYKRSLMVEASTIGTPVTRPLLLAFPDCNLCRANAD
jgi:alpha-glucosidase